MKKDKNYSIKRLIKYKDKNLDKEIFSKDWESYNRKIT